MVRWLLSGLRRAGFDYACFRIFAFSLDTTRKAPDPSIEGYRFTELLPADLEACPYTELRDCDWYFGPGSCAFGVFRKDGALACAQWLWFGDRYGQASFWPLAANEAASVQLITAAPERGKGLATGLKNYSAQQMRQRGYSRLYSRIWWTNAASIRVSRKAGWKEVGMVLEVSAPFFSRPLRIVRRKADPRV